MSAPREAQEDVDNTPPREDDASADQSLAAERRIPSVNRVRSLQSRVTTVLTVTVMCGLALALLAWYYARALSDGDDPAVRTNRRAASSADTFLPALTGIPEPPPPALEAPPPQVSAVTGPAENLPRRRAGNTGKDAGRELTAPVYARHRSATSEGANWKGPSNVRSMSATANSGESLIPELPGDDASDDLSSRLRSTRRAGATAYALASPHLTLREGFHIDCTLETAITSSLPGSTRCVTATDTWSSDGSVVLIERGTTIVGETQGIATQGNHRLFILWTHAYTPNHVVVPLDAPGTDALGRAGVTGSVDYHFFQRFGAAMLISVIDGAAQSATTRSRNGNNGIVINTNPSRDLVLEVLRHTSNIRPTVGVHQGAHVQVAVSRNVDFSGVYELTRRNQR